MQVDNEYAFDITLASCVRVHAPSRIEAVELLNDCIERASAANLGAWPDGNEITAEVSLIKSEVFCFEVNGDDKHPEVCVSDAPDIVKLLNDLKGFVSGFEDDECQDGLPEKLIADIDKFLAVRGAK